LRYDNVKRLTRQAVDLILSPRCPVTGDIVDRPGMLSPAAWASLRFVSAPQCECCGIPFEILSDDGRAGGGDLLCGPCLAEPKLFARARSCLVYDDNSRPLILAFKHGDKTHLSVTFAGWLQQAAEPLLGDIDMIVPVPLHRMRLLKRRYNQAGLLGYALSRRCGKPCVPDILMRTRNTEPQGHLSRSKRAENMHRAFSVNDSKSIRLNGQKILLVDDVYTTGATLNECVRVLLAAGAQRVDVLTLARVVRPDILS
jgi:ComF family protein